MKQLIVASFALFSLVGCGGGDVCARLTAAQDTAFAGKTECKSSQDLTVHRPAGTCSLTGCSDSDQKALDNYAACLEKATPCTDGNEDAASSAIVACAFANAAGVSQTCSDNLK